MDQAPEEILRRLEELREWQSQQQEKLLSKQLSHSELCSMEKQKLCEMFGFSITSTVSNLSFSQNETEQYPNKCDKPSKDAGHLATNTISPSSQKQFQGKTPINNFSLDELESYGNTQNQPNCNFEEKPKKSFLKRGQGLASRFKIHPEKLRIENLPKYKFANAHKESKFFRNNKNPGEVKSVAVPSCKPSSDDLKLTRTNSAKRVIISMSTEQKELKNYAALPHSKTSYEHNQPFTSDTNIPSSATWAKVLEPEPETKNFETESKLSIPRKTFNTPTMKEKVQKQHQDQRDLQIFEILEQNLNNSGFSSDSRIMQQIMSYISSANNKNRSLQQGAHTNFEKLPTTDSEDEHRSANEQKRNVRFAVKSSANDVNSECETMSSTDMEEMNVSKTSTPIGKTAFEMFKKNLFANRTADDSTLIKQPLKDNSMQLRNEELKERLTELQNEIELFRQQNVCLTKMMREHEVLKLQWEEEKTEFMDKLEDERIRQEVVLHDERMKLVDEHKKLDKRAKELQTPNRKDREDVVKLKKEIADLQKESTSKDQKHISAQARLRAQIRNMEKDLKEFSLEIDHLRKENKKIESENVRLRRQNNNKMLNEINKNIAKLAPKIDTENENQMNFNQDAKQVNVMKSRESRSKSVPNLIEVKEVPKVDVSVESDSELSSSSSAPGPDERSRYFKANRTKSSPSKNNQKITKSSEQISNLDTNQSVNLKREIMNDDGSRDIWYPNGNLKKVSADEMIIRMLYFNKDVKETNIHEGTVKYYYAEANTWQTTYLDGLEIWEFPNGRIEHHYKDGRIEAHHSDGSICTTNPNDLETTEEWKYMNGTTFVIKRNGDKYLSLPNGQREVTTKNHIRREYPDGTVKIKYPDGSLETRYSNGRIRLRDSAGTLVRDSGNQ